MSIGPAVRVTPTVEVPVEEIELRYSRSSGPGGQHAQKTSTRVEAILDVETSTAFDEAQRARVLERLGPVVRAVAQDSRSQARNRDLAVERLVDTLREAMHVDRPRRATRPTVAARQRRLDSKRRRTEVKRLRGRVDDD